MLVSKSEVHWTQIGENVHVFMEKSLQKNLKKKMQQSLLKSLQDTHKNLQVMLTVKKKWNKIGFSKNLHLHLFIGRGGAGEGTGCYYHTCWS